METLADRAHRAALTHPVPALSLAELIRRLRAEGCPVTPSALIQALESEPARFRLLRPWRGSLAILRDRGSDTTERPEDELMVVVVDGGSDSDPLGQVRRSLALLGSELDDRSEIERSRWLAMVREAFQLHAA